MSPNTPRKSGRFSRINSVRPAIEATFQPAETTATTGNLIAQGTVAPVVEVDCALWAEQPITLELLLDTAPGADAIQLALRMQNALKAVNHLDRTLGGTGLSILTGNQTSTGLTMILSPDEALDALTRIRGICDMVNGGHQPRSNVSIPGFVRGAAVRVA